MTEQEYTDGVVVTLSIGFTLKDRIKLLFGRDLIVKFTLETEHKIGRSRSDAISYVAPISRHHENGLDESEVLDEC